MHGVLCHRYLNRVLMICAGNPFLRVMYSPSDLAPLPNMGTKLSAPGAEKGQKESRKRKSLASKTENPGSLRRSKRGTREHSIAP